MTYTRTLFIKSTKDIFTSGLKSAVVIIKNKDASKGITRRTFGNSHMLSLVVMSG
jgi:hypothetical protein